MAKSREEYSEEIGTIENLTNYTDSQKQSKMIAIMVEILLDIKEKLYNPDLK